MPALSFSDWVLVFILYSFLGWICETAWCSLCAKKFVNRGFFGGPWSPIYGFGAVIILLLAESAKEYPVLVFVLAMASATMLEYASGWLMEALFKARWWDYSAQRFQLKGRICLRNTLVFGVLGLGVVYMSQPVFLGLLARIPASTQRVLASVIIVVFFLDLVRSLAAATKLDEQLQKLRGIFRELERDQNEHAWYDKADVPGSIGRLRTLCALEPQNGVAAAVLARIDAEVKGGREGARLVRAYPDIRFRQFHTEFTALRLERERREERRRRALSAAWAELREKARAEREEARLSYRDLTASRIIWVFLIGSVLGYVVETAFCFAVTGVITSRQGMLYGPFSQIYGFGAVVMVLLLTPFARKGDRWLFGGGALVGGLFETVSSLIQEGLFGSTSWDYSEQSFSFFGGRTSLLFMFFWGILAVVYMKHIYPHMASVIDRVPIRPRRFFTYIIVFVLSADMALSVMALGRWSGRQSGRSPENAVQGWLDERYPDDMMREIFSNMQFRMPDQAF